MEVTRHESTKGEEYTKVGNGWFPELGEIGEWEWMWNNVNGDLIQTELSLENERYSRMMCTNLNENLFTVGRK